MKNLQTFTALAEADGVATAAVSQRDWTSYDPAALSPEELSEIERRGGRLLRPAHHAPSCYDQRCGHRADAGPDQQRRRHHRLEAAGRPAVTWWPSGDIPSVPRAFARTEPDRIGATRRSHHRRHAPPGPPTLPLRFARQAGRAWEGLKIVELGSGAAGPIATRYFADHGATVVRIESHTRPDFLRSYSSQQFAALGTRGQRVLLRPQRRQARRLAQHAPARRRGLAPPAVHRMGRRRVGELRAGRHGQVGP